LPAFQGKTTVDQEYGAGDFAQAHYFDQLVGRKEVKFDFERMKKILGQ
jgi:hypothetical protein